MTGDVDHVRRTAHADEDVLADLLRDRGDEMWPSLHALARATSTTLRVGAGVGLIASMIGALAVATIVTIRFHTGAAPFVYVVIEMPTMYFGWRGIQALRRRIARAIVRRIERSLDAVGGASTPMMLSLRATSSPPKVDER